MSYLLAIFGYLMLGGLSDERAIANRRLSLADAAVDKWLRHQLGRPYP